MIIKISPKIPKAYVCTGARVPTTVGELERENAALVQVKLVFVRLGVVKHLHVAALHAHSQPLSSGTVSQWEDLQQRRSIAVRSHGSNRRQNSLKGLFSTCEVKSCCWSWRPSLKSQERTVLSSPPVHSLVPSWDMSMQLAPSVWPWNCLEQQGAKNKVRNATEYWSSSYEIQLFITVGFF